MKDIHVTEEDFNFQRRLFWILCVGYYKSYYISSFIYNVIIYNITYTKKKKARNCF